jgi:hypothetical protein
MGHQRFVNLACLEINHQLSVIELTPKIRYLKKVDSFQNNHVHTFLTGGNVKFMLLMNADPLATPYSNFASPPPSRSTSARQSTLIANNPSSSQTEDAVRGFVTEVSSFLATSDWVGESHPPSLLTDLSTYRSTKLG